MAASAKTDARQYATPLDVRWCPGCGDFAILRALRNCLAGLNAAPHQQVCVSGIGCSSRLPYYMETYGFHTVHGRAPTIATGLALTRPDLGLWVITGDGDGLSIGCGHLHHFLRRDLNAQILLFNNEVYGLTKGQFAPTSRRGTRTPSSPHGVKEASVNPSLFALGAGARFVARACDTDKDLSDIMRSAYEHYGAAFVEIYQNCIVFNPDIFKHLTDRNKRDAHRLHVQHGKKMLFDNEQRGLVFDAENFRLQVVDHTPATQDSILIHDCSNKLLAWLLAACDSLFTPCVTGILYAHPGDDPVPCATDPAEVPAPHLLDVEQAEKTLSCLFPRVN